MTLIYQMHLLIISATIQLAILLLGLQAGVFLQGVSLSFFSLSPYVYHGMSIDMLQQGGQLPTYKFCH